MFKSAWILLATLSIVLAATVSDTYSKNGKFELLILHNNDMHARFEQTLSTMTGSCTETDDKPGKCYGGFARVANVVRQARAAADAGTGPPVLYLNAGDTYTGTAWFTIYKWQIAAAFLNALHPDAVSLGNHEFDNGVSGLTPFVENLTSPILAANIVLNKVPVLENEPNLHKSIVLDVQGTKIGIIGYLTPETKFLAIKNDVDYVEEVSAIREEVEKLKANGTKILIALGHSGFETDKAIAKQVDGIDLVIGGHTNTFLWNGTSPDAEKIDGPYPTMVQQDSGKLVPVVQAYAYTKYLGKLHIVFNSEGEIESTDGNPILLDSSIPQDNEVLELINKYSIAVRNVTQEVVGKSLVLLDSDQISCRLQECNLGNLITDAMVYHYSVNFNATDNWTDAPVAMIQGGGIRGSIDAEGVDGDVTMGDLLTILPFESKVIVVTMTGQTILDALEHSVSHYSLSERRGAFLQYSGIRVVYDLSKESGSRVVSSGIRCSSCHVPQYYDIQINGQYKVLLPQFLAEGGDDFTMFEQTVSREEMPYDELHTVADYFRRRSPVYPEISRRITLLGLEDLPEQVNSSSTIKLSALSLVIAALQLAFRNSI